MRTLMTRATSGSVAVLIAQGLTNRQPEDKRKTTMFRKLILSAVLSTATMTGFAATEAQARPPIAHNHRFEVMVECGRRWENRGTFANRFEAERIAERLRCEGFRVQVREC
jgi:hypothetical protein